MNKLIASLTLCLALSVATAQRNFYVSATGNDAAAGTSPGAAWRTPKLGTFTFTDYDTIRFQRGDSFLITAALLVPRNRLIFDAYGNHPDQPVITSMVPVTSWAPAGTNIYRAPINARPSLTIVTVASRPQQIGRWPNATAANAGYRNYSTVGTWYIEDPTLTDAQNFTGATVVIRGNAYTANTGVITSQGNGRINYRFGRNVNAGTAPLFDVVKLNFGFFFQNDPRTLDQPGEWFNDTIKRDLNLFSTSLPANVAYAACDTLFSIGSRSNITVQNITFIGANHTAIIAQNGDSITIRNCKIYNAVKGIQLANVGNSTVVNVTADFTLSTAIQIQARQKRNVLIDNCIITRNAPYIGMGGYYSSADHKAIVASASSGVTVTNCRIDSTALAAIEVAGNNVRVSKNVATNYCQKLDDGSAIYMYAGVGSPRFTNRVIDSNIVMYGGAPSAGTDSPNDTIGNATGIYLDGITMSVRVRGNTIIKPGKNGIHSNNGDSIEIEGNTVYAAQNQISFMRWPYGSVTNMKISRNIIFATKPSQANILYTNAALNEPQPTTLQAAIKSVGKIDSNYYSNISPAGFQYLINDNSTSSQYSPTPHSFAAWQSFTGFDKHSVLLTKFKPYRLDSTIGNNLVINSTFDKQTTPWLLFGRNTTFSWVAGTGRMAFTVPEPNRWSMIHSQIGPVSSSKKYLIRFTTSGTNFGLARAYLRSSSTYVDLAARQMVWFDATTRTHDVLISTPTTASRAALCIELEQNSGATAIDNIQLFEAAAKTNTLQDLTSLYVNDQATPVTYRFNKQYSDATGTTYRYEVTVPPYSSRLLFLEGILQATTSNVIIRSRQ